MELDEEPNKSSEHIITEDNNRGKKRMQYTGACIAFTWSFSIGCMIGWASPAGPVLIAGGAGFPVTEDQNSWVGSLLPIGAAVSCIPTGYIIDLVGRKRTLLGIVPIIVLSWALIIWSNSVGMLYAGRVFSGLCVGSISCAAPVFSSEICEKHIRGALGSWFEMFMVIGVLYAYIVGSFDVFWLSVTAAIISIVFGIIFFFFPETPVYHLSKNQLDRARKSLTFYRGNEYNIESELIELSFGVKSNSEDEKESLWKAFRSRRAIKSFAIALVLMIAQQLTGFSAVVFNTTTIFMDAGTSLRADHATILTGIMQLAGVFVMGFLIERLGRKILLIGSASAMCICTTALGVYFYLKEHGEDVSSITWVPLASLCIYVYAFESGFGPIPWVMIPEILPLRIKGVASSIANATSWFIAFLVTKLFYDLINAFGQGGTYWLFAGFNVLTIVFCAFLPETKGKSFEQIQNDLGGHKASKLV